VVRDTQAQAYGYGEALSSAVVAANVHPRR
jgi:hypothetical protein